MEKFKSAALSKKNGKAEIAVLLLYTVGLIIIMMFHELWFDEAQSWQIAATASYKDILFNVPHYEGHPQFWHLFLSVFAKNGFPYELTLKSINVVISVSAIAVLLFRSPFPKIVKCTLPFTYFLFYQFGINSRPYSITMLSLFLAAIFHKNRNEHPMRYILSLTLLCLTTAYGIILAGGLCLVWTFEIFLEHLSKKDVKGIFADKRCYSLLLILAVAVFLILSILPRDDTFYTGCMSDATLADKLTKLLAYAEILCIPFDSWSGNFISSITTVPVAIAASVIGIFTYYVLISITKANKKLLTFLIPYLMMTGFMVLKYMAEYHLGISAIFHIFIFWIMIDGNGKLIIPDNLTSPLKKISSPVIMKALKAVSVVICIIPLYYSAAACVNEIKYCYGNSNLKDFIIENDIQDRKLMIMWPYLNYDDEDGEVDPKQAASVTLEMLTEQMEIPSEHKKIKTHYTYLTGLGATLTPYFGKNIFINFNADCPDDLYMHYKYKEDSETIMKLWAEKGLPDFIFDYSPVDEVYDEQTLEGIKYLPVHEAINVRIFKDSYVENKDLVYMREDLFDEYPQLKWIYDPKADLYEIKKDD